MFQFTGFPPYSYMKLTLPFTVWCLGLPQTGFPIQIPADLCLFAAPRGFSQLITSFFGS